VVNFLCTLAGAVAGLVTSLAAQHET
jgi:hypothetical protein